MIRKIRLILVILLVSLNVASQTRSDKLLNNLHDKNSKYIFVIAHRGDWRNAPENSIQCIENAIEMGVDMVEIDIQPTKDRNFICMHDETLERTSTGVGAIKDYTTEELKKLVLRSGNGIKTRRQIPTLEEVLKVCKNRILVNIDKGEKYIKEILPLSKNATWKSKSLSKGNTPLRKSRKAMVQAKECYICLLLIYGMTNQLHRYRNLSKTLFQWLTSFVLKTKNLST